MSEAFLKELTELTRKHGIRIGGCGCCHSPWLEEVVITSPESRYVMNKAYAKELIFIQPGDYYWGENMKEDPK